MLNLEEESITTKTVYRDEYRSDWIATEKLVVIPVFGDLKLSAKIASEEQLFLQAGYGRSIVIGRGNLTGDYKKIGIGFKNTTEGLGLFAEVTQYGFTLHSAK